MLPRRQFKLILASMLVILFYSIPVLAVTEAQVVSQAKGLYESGRYQDEQKYLLENMKLFPKSAVIYNELARTYTKLDRPKLAIHTYEKALQLDPGLYSARLDLSTIYLDNKNYTKALVHLKELIKVDNKNPVLAEKLGILYYNQKNYPEAITYFKQALTIDPAASVGVNNYLGMAYYMRGDKQSALISLQRAQKAGRLTEEGKRLAALLSLDANDNPQAIAFINELIAAGVANTDDYNNLGTAYSRINDLTRAVDAYRHVLAEDPKHVAALQNLALAYMHQEEYEQAEVVWEKYIAQRPNDATAYYDLGLTQENLEHYQQALATYQRAKDLGYDDTVRIGKAIAYMRSKIPSPNEK